MAKSSTTGASLPIDPTANVLQLVEAAIKRQDDLRDMEAHHLREIMAMRENTVHEIREMESRRIDAIRAVDVEAVARAASTSAAAAASLASTVSASAEALRSQVAAAASAAATALGAALEPIQKDIADLRRAQYEQQGRQVNQTESKDNNQWVIGLVIGAVVVLLAALLALSPHISFK